MTEKKKWFMPYGKFRIDLSLPGHAVASAAITSAIAGVLFVLAGGFHPGMIVAGALCALWFFIGREMRDCENAMGYKAGSPKAWFVMWWRWQNMLDMAGPLAVFIAAVAYAAGLI